MRCGQVLLIETVPSSIVNIVLGIGVDAHVAQLNPEHCSVSGWSRKFGRGSPLRSRTRTFT